MQFDSCWKIWINIIVNNYILNLFSFQEQKYFLSVFVGVLIQIRLSNKSFLVQPKFKWFEFNYISKIDISIS